MVEAITAEIHMMSRLSHPNVVRILGATKQGCHFNMFVEWMSGEGLQWRLDRGCYNGCGVGLVMWDGCGMVDGCVIVDVGWV